MTNTSVEIKEKKKEKERKTPKTNHTLKLLLWTPSFGLCNC